MNLKENVDIYFVAPFTGAWIEIDQHGPMVEGCRVAPFTGAWIEIEHGIVGVYLAGGSLPSRERGLKCPAS